ncbi:MAG: cadmium resistance transporter [Synechococcus lacustris]
MDWLPATFQIAFGAGLASTFDDNIYLTGFFGEVNRTFRPKHIIVGEILGFSVLILISLIGCALGLVIPSEYIGLLGVLPILIGIKNLQEHINSPKESDQDKKRSRRKFAELKGFESRQLSLAEVLRDGQTYNVSLVTISNGGNNLSIYIPLFASLGFPRVGIVIAVMYAFIGTWLFLAFHLTRMPGIALVLNRYAGLFFPFVLMWLGFRILSDTQALTLLAPLSH